MSNENIVYVTDDNFEELVIKSEKPVLVDFWAEWCGPCRSIAPLLDELADEFKGQVVIAKVNVDESTKVPTQYGVRGIPTMILFDKGEQKDTLVGANPPKIRSMVESVAN